jgi:hypothetical protein
VATSFRPNRGLELELKPDPRVQAVVNARVQAALMVAQRIAAGFAASGDYARSLAAEGNRLYSTDPGSWAQEMGAPSKNTPARAPLRKAAISVGAVIGHE